MPRHKIARQPKNAIGADSGGDPASDLPDLTECQQEYARQRALGKNGADAYRLAYDCTNMAPNTIHAVASRLYADARVQAWIAAYRKAGMVDTAWTRERMIARLDADSELALEAGNHGARYQNTWGMAQLSGLVVQQYADVTRDPTRILDELATMIGKDQAAAVMDMVKAQAAMTIEHAPPDDGEHEHEQERD